MTNTSTSKRAVSDMPPAETTGSPGPRSYIAPGPNQGSEGPRASGFRLGRWVIGGLSVGLLVWIGMRINSAVEEKAEVALVRDAVAAQAKESATQPRQVQLVRGTAEEAIASVSFEGTLQPLEQAELGFKVSGRLVTLKVAVGDRVKRGSLLAQLEASEAAAQVKSAEASLRAAEAQLALATDSEARTRRVVSQGVQPESVGVQATQQKSLAEAQRDGASAQLQLARQNLANHSILAPFDGTVIRAPDGAGAIVSPGVPLILLSDLSRLKLVGSVSATDARFLRVGAPVEILVGGNVVGKGEVTAIVAALDDTTKRVPVQAVVENDGAEELIAGTLVRARVRGTEPVPVVRLPHTVLKPGSQDEVLVVKDGRLEGRRINFEVAEDGALLVRQGVTAEDDLLAEPWPEAKTGDVVRSNP